MSGNIHFLAVKNAKGVDYPTVTLDNQYSLINILVQNEDRIIQNSLLKILDMNMTVQACWIDFSPFSPVLCTAINISA